MSSKIDEAILETESQEVAVRTFKQKLFHYIWKIHDKLGICIINWKITNWVWKQSIGYVGLLGNGW